MIRLDHRTRISAHAHNTTLRLVDSLNRGVTPYSGGGIVGMGTVTAAGVSTEIWQGYPIVPYTPPDGIGYWNANIHDMYVDQIAPDGLLKRSPDPGPNAHGGVIGEAGYGASYYTIPDTPYNFMGVGCSPVGNDSMPWYYDGVHSVDAGIQILGASAFSMPNLIASIPDGSVIESAHVEMQCGTFIREQYECNTTYHFDWDPNSSSWVAIFGGATTQTTTDQGGIGITLLGAYRVGSETQWYVLGGGLGCSDYQAGKVRVWDATGCAQAMLAHRHDPYLINFGWVAGPMSSYVVGTANTGNPDDTMRPLVDALLKSVTVEWDVTATTLTPANKYLYCKKIRWSRTWYDTMVPGSAMHIKWTYPDGQRGEIIPDAQFPAVM